MLWCCSSLGMEGVDADRPARFTLPSLGFFKKCELQNGCPKVVKAYCKFANFGILLIPIQALPSIQSNPIQSDVPPTCQWSQGYVDGIEFFDHKFFGISTVEARPQKNSKLPHEASTVLPHTLMKPMVVAKESYIKLYKIYIEFKTQISTFWGQVCQSSVSNCGNLSRFGQPSWLARQVQWTPISARQELRCVQSPSELHICPDPGNFLRNHQYGRLQT